MTTDAGVQAPYIDSVVVMDQDPAPTVGEVNPYDACVVGRFVDVSRAQHGVSTAEFNEFMWPQVFPVLHKQGFTSSLVFTKGCP